MMRLSRIAVFSVIVCAVVGLLVMGGSRFPLPEKWSGQPPWSEPATSAQPLLAQLSSNPVDGDRLLRDVEMLATVRHSEDERQHARQYILTQLQLAGWHPEEQIFEASLAGSRVTGVNIIAIQPGRSSDAGTIVLGAHYDSVIGSPGADDNASAVAVVLELARSLSDVPTHHPLAIALFDLEELGFLGSTAFVQDMGRSLTIEGAVILEMVGYACHTTGCQTYPSVLPIDPPSDTGDFLAVVGDLGHPFLVDAFKGNASETNAVEEPQLPSVVTLQVPTFGQMTPDLFRSDHVPFWRHGIGAVMVTDTANFRNPHYHQPSDRPETLDMEFLKGSAMATLQAIARLLQN
ncbi:MAG: M28 family peptidase [Cyanobacteria bacterium P01_E01_bin.6]